MLFLRMKPRFKQGPVKMEFVHQEIQQPKGPGAQFPGLEKVVLARQVESTFMSPAKDARWPGSF
jgi:hypothetical protein